MKISGEMSHEKETSALFVNYSTIPPNRVPNQHIWASTLWTKGCGTLHIGLQMADCFMQPAWFRVISREKCKISHVNVGTGSIHSAQCRLTEPTFTKKTHMWKHPAWIRVNLREFLTDWRIWDQKVSVDQLVWFCQQCLLTPWNPRCCRLLVCIMC